MPDSRADSVVRGGGGAILASALAGGLVGAAGLAWWLLNRSERRRFEQRARRVLHQPEIAPHDLERPPLDAQLHDRVQQLNQAIDEVRRQLERMQPQS
jgi:hypothetical protein